METIQLGASAPDVLELVMTDLHERQENVNAVDFRSQKKNVSWAESVGRTRGCGRGNFADFFRQPRLFG